MRRLLALSLLILFPACAGNSPASIEESLLLAADNRTELEMVLGHYRRLRDPQKLDAASFLIANMSMHGAVQYERTDPSGEPTQHGEELERTGFDSDVEQISSEFLIENIELAFEAWRTLPWARDLSYDVFEQYVLPYRVGNEPLSRWRAECMAEFADLPRRLEDPTDVYLAARLVREGVNDWMSLSDPESLNRTEQSFAEMRRTGVGHHEDLSNLASFAMRANAIPVTTDFTPWWADRVGNQSWKVVLDKTGNGNAVLSHRAAKVYRKSFAIQHETLAGQLPPDTAIPKPLDRADFVDVTDQYVDTTEVELYLPEGAKERAAYLCVFNGGEWRAVCGSLVAADGTVHFPALGREVCYLPAWYRDGELVPAAAPFVLHTDGSLEPLDARTETREVMLRGVAEVDPDAAAVVDPPAFAVEAGVSYELFSWEGDWKSRGKTTLAEGSSFGCLAPEGALLWLVREGSDRLERPFTIQDGAPTSW